MCKHATWLAILALSWEPQAQIAQIGYKRMLHFFGYCTALRLTDDFCSVPMLMHALLYSFVFRDQRFLINVEISIVKIASLTCVIASFAIVFLKWELLPFGSDHFQMNTACLNVLYFQNHKIDISNNTKIQPLSPYLVWTTHLLV